MVSIMTLQNVNLSAQSRYELKIDYQTSFSHDKNGGALKEKYGIYINGRRISEDKYRNIDQRKGYIFALYNRREYPSSYGFITVGTTGIAADIYDANGRLKHSVSEGYCDVERYKDPDFTMWQKTDLSWYDENGKFIYKGGWVYTGSSRLDEYGLEDKRYEGDNYRFYTTPNGYFYFVIYNSKSYDDQKLVLYNATKNQVGTLSLYGEHPTLFDFSPIGYYFSINGDCYDMNLNKVPYKYFGGVIHSIIINGTTHVFYHSYNEETRYLPHFNNKNIKDARRYEKQGLVLIQMVDGNVYDMHGNLLFKSNGKLPSSYDLFDPGNGKYLVWTRDGNKKGISTLDGKEILAPEFEEVKVLSDNLYAFTLNGYWGVMKVAGNVNKVIIPIERAYTKIEYSRTLKQFTFEKVSAKGTCNANGVQTSITKVAPPQTQTPSQPANSNRPQQQPTQGNQPDVKTPVYMPCPTCGGTLHCPTCAGTGSYWSGSDKRRCGVCNGTGVCQSCHGTGTNAVIYY